MSLRDTITALCLERLGREPELDNPTGFNDLIQWLKLHDQRPEHATACDKWAVREMVAKRADCLIPARLGFSAKWMPSVMKCTHDCGSVQFVDGIGDFKKAQAALKESLKVPYGVGKGEWAYELIKPRVMTEKLLGRDVTDYKFHCSHGRIRWVQMIRGRFSGETRETILAPSGEVMALHMDQNMAHDPDAKAYPGDEAWAALAKVAKKLAKEWRYVRVDLYWVRQRAWFGELTFWPLAGCYMTDDEPTFGDMLELDLSERFAPIIS